MQQEQLHGSRRRPSAQPRPHSAARRRGSAARRPRAGAAQAQAAAAQAAQDKAAADAARAAALSNSNRPKPKPTAPARLPRKPTPSASRRKPKRRNCANGLKAQLNAILETRETARGLIVNINDVLFDFNKYTLKPGAREKMAKVSGILLAYPGLKLQLEGHTDSVGGDDYNLKLSQERADAVRDFLAEQGVAGGKYYRGRVGQSRSGGVQRHGRRDGSRIAGWRLVVSGEAIGMQGGERAGSKSYLGSRGWWVSGPAGAEAYALRPARLCYPLRHVEIAADCIPGRPGVRAAAGPRYFRQLGIHRGYRRGQRQPLVRLQAGWREAHRHLHAACSAKPI